MNWHYELTYIILFIEYEGSVESKDKLFIGVGFNDVGQQYSWFLLNNLGVIGLVKVPDTLKSFHLLYSEYNYGHWVHNSFVKSVLHFSSSKEFWKNTVSLIYW